MILTKIKYKRQDQNYFAATTKFDESLITVSDIDSDTFYDYLELSNLINNDDDTTSNTDP